MFMGKGLTIAAFIFSLIFPIVGLILGLIAYSEAKKDPEALKGLALAAIIISIVFIVIPLIFLIVVGTTWFAVKGSVESGANQLELSSQCALINLKINSIDSDTNNIIIERGSGAGELSRVKIVVNEIEKEFDARSLIVGGTQSFDVDVEQGDLVKVYNIVEDYICPNFVSQVVS